MAKKSVEYRQIKREGIVKKYATKRAELKAKVKDLNATMEERFAAQLELQKLPRNASPSRLVIRCRLTGRARGVYRKFGLGRNKLREYTMNGEIAGLRKSSW